MVFVTVTVVVEAGAVVVMGFSVIVEMVVALMMFRSWHTTFWGYLRSSR